LDNRESPRDPSLFSLGVVDRSLLLDFTPSNGLSVSIHSLETDFPVSFLLTTEGFLFLSIILITVCLFKTSLGIMGLFLFDVEMSLFC